MGISKRKIRNRRVIKQLCECLQKYNQVIIVKLDNVSNRQVQNARVAIQKSESGGELIVGKNSIIKKALKWLTTEPQKEAKDFADHSRWERRPLLKTLGKLIEGNIGLIFSDEDYTLLKNKIEAEIIEVEAKVGVIAPCDVIIPKGPTTIDTGKVNVFQKLQVPTKTFKNCLEIQKDIHIIVKGEPVSSAAAELCRLLQLKPFSYRLEMKNIWMNGSILDEEVININPDTITASFQDYVRTLTALSLGAGLPNVLSVPHMIAEGFKSCLAVGLAIDYQFKELESAMANQGSAPEQAGGAADQKQGDAPEEAAPEEEPEDVSMGGLFD